MRVALRLLLVAFLATPAFAAKVILINSDIGTNGFNDATPAFPFAGNTGTTRGQQRLIAVQAALDKWGAILNSEVDIVVDAAFSSPSFGTCSGNSATLAFANTIEWVFNFEGAPQRDVLYPVALANKLLKRDFSPNSADIRIRFNSQIDLATCLGDSSFYYGLDGASGADVDLIATAMHELAHGLGFSGNADALTGGFRGPTFLPAIYDVHIFDNSAGLRWDQMTSEQRTLSAVNNQNVVWDGQSTTTAAKDLLPTPVLSVTAPASIARRFTIASHTNGWSSRITIPGVTGAVVAPQDAVEPTIVDDNGVTQVGSATNGCSVYTNLGDVRGKFALVDRGYCTFLIKAQRALDAGAIGVIIANNDGAVPSAMGADAGASVNLPVVMVSKADGAAIRGALNAGVSLTLFADPQQLAGADQAGRVKLYMPAEFESGSSVYHFDVSATPNLLMEPQINSGLPHTGDLTVNHMADIGWASSDSNPVEPEPPTGRRILKRKR